VHHQTHLDTVLGMRARYMAGMGREEEEGSPFMKVCFLLLAQRPSLYACVPAAPLSTFLPRIVNQIPG